MASEGQQFDLWRKSCGIFAGGLIAPESLFDEQIAGYNLYVESLVPCYCGDSNFATMGEIALSLFYQVLRKTSHLARFKKLGLLL